MSKGLEEPELLTSAALQAERFRRAIQLIPAGMVVIAAEPRPEEAACELALGLMAASWQPPRVALSIPGKSPLAVGCRFSLSLLRAGQKPPGPQDAGRWEQSAGGFLMLRDCLVSLACESREVLATGDLKLVVADILDTFEQPGEPLVRWSGGSLSLRLDYPFLQTEQALDAFLHRWETGTLPKPEWTHAAHVAVAAHHAFLYDRAAALRLTKAGILRYNESVGTANTDHSGYHETLTVLWAALVREFLTSKRHTTRLDAVRDAVQRFGQDRERHRLHYSFDVVRSVEARRQWVEPDLMPVSGVGWAAAG